MLQEIMRRLQAFVYPSRCLLCNGDQYLKAGMDICQGCLADLPRMRRACVRCATSLVSNPGAAEQCGRCLSDPPPFARTWCLGPYEGGLAALITGLKFNKRLENGRLLGQLLGHYLAAHPDCRRLSLLPVPLHPARLRRRGFNQAQEIAKWAGLTAGIKVIGDGARRQRNTRAQTGLGATMRRSNLAGAFVCRENLRGKRVALVDDVMTTGSTAASLAATLRRAGCNHIEVWCCARASLHGQHKKSRTTPSRPAFASNKKRFT